MRKLIGICGMSGMKPRYWANYMAELIDRIVKKQDLEIDEDSISENRTMSTNYVSVDSFCESIFDLAKIFNPNLYDINLHDKAETMSAYVNLKTFEVTEIQHPNLEPEYVFNYVKQFGSLPQGDCWMLVKDYVMYFAHYIVKSFFGQQAWLNVVRATEMDTDDYKIFWDVKTQCEYDFIKENGIIIHLGYGDTYRDIKNFKPDYSATTKEEIINSIKQITNVSDNA